MNCFTRVFPVYTLGVANITNPDQPIRSVQRRASLGVRSGAFRGLAFEPLRSNPPRHLKICAWWRPRSEKGIRIPEIHPPLFDGVNFLAFWKASVSSVKMRIFPKWKWKLHEIAFKWKNIQGLCQLWFDSTKETTWDSNVQHRPGRSPSMCSLLREGNSFTLQGG